MAKNQYDEAISPLVFVIPVTLLPTDFYI